MSKQREDTCRHGLCRVFTSLTRVRQVSYVLSPEEEPYWLGCIRPFERAARRRRAATILSRMFETMQRRTMILTEEGDSEESFPGISRTTPLAMFREAGGYLWEIRGERSWRRMEGLITLTHFQVR